MDTSPLPVAAGGHARWGLMSSVLLVSQSRNFADPKHPRLIIGAPENLLIFGVMVAGGPPARSACGGMSGVAAKVGEIVGLTATLQLLTHHTPDER